MLVMCNNNFIDLSKNALINVLASQEKYWWASGILSVVPDWIVEIDNKSYSNFLSYFELIRHIKSIVLYIALWGRHLLKMYDTNNPKQLL